MSARILLEKSDNSSYSELVARVATEADVPARELMPRSLLELWRIADVFGLVDLVAAEHELYVVADRMPPNSHWTPFKGLPPCATRGLTFGVVPRDVAKTILTDFHYIGEDVRDALQVGLFREGHELPVAMASLERVDRPAAGLLSSLLPVDEFWKASRVFAFHDAPRNSLSRLLRIAGEYLCVSGAVAHLETRVALPLFDGSSYRASGWTETDNEKQDIRPYRYIDGKHVTARHYEEVLQQAFSERKARPSLPPISQEVAPGSPGKRTTFAQIFPSEARVSEKHRRVLPQPALPPREQAGQDVISRLEHLLDLGARALPVTRTAESEREHYANSETGIVKLLAEAVEQLPEQFTAPLHPVPFHRGPQMDALTYCLQRTCVEVTAYLSELRWSIWLAEVRDYRLNPFRDAPEHVVAAYALGLWMHNVKQDLSELLLPKGRPQDWASYALEQADRRRSDAKRLRVLPRKIEPWVKFGREIIWRYRDDWPKLAVPQASGRAAIAELIRGGIRLTPLWSQEPTLETLGFD